MIQLAPDVENAVRDEAASRGISIDVLIREALDAIRAKPTPAPRDPTTHEVRARWIAEHSKEYLGQWIVFDGARFLASGHNAKELFDNARAQGVVIPAMLFVSADDDLPFAGW